MKVVIDWNKFLNIHLISIIIDDPLVNKEGYLLWSNLGGNNFGGLIWGNVVCNNDINTTTLSPASLHSIFFLEQNKIIIIKITPNLRTIQLFDLNWIRGGLLTNKLQGLLENVSGRKQQMWRGRFHWEGFTRIKRLRRQYFTF